MQAWLALTLCISAVGCEEAPVRRHSDSAIGTDGDAGGTPLCDGGACTDASPGSCGDSPMATNEVCNGLDDDCDGRVDEDVEQGRFVDADGDGYGRSDMPVPGCEQKEGLADIGGDCDDDDPQVFPGPAGQEACNGIDDNCNGEVDEGCPCLPDEQRMCGSRDGDGNLLTSGRCQPGVQPCEDGELGSCSGAILATEESCNGEDDDCDGVVDDGVLIECWPDEDGDGFARLGTAATLRCACHDDETAREPTQAQSDCSEGRRGGSRHPDAEETCNGEDDDCDGRTDEGIASTYYPDSDGDGYGVSWLPLRACFSPGSGFARRAGDCRDDDASIHPDADEICDGIDNDCSGLADDGPRECQCLDSDPPLECGPIKQHGVGICRKGTQACVDGSWSDTCEGAVPPEGAQESACDGRDEDCDGMTDEGLTTPCWPDLDGDGFAPSTATATHVCGSCGDQQTATEPVGSAVDCNDESDAIRPGAMERCNGRDDNCSGGIDEGNPPDTCVDADIVATCRNGAMQEDHSCRAQGQTCVDGACIGECAAGERVCVEGENAYRVCQDDGTPAESSRVECDGTPGEDASWQVCRDGACVESQPRTMGPDQAEGWEVPLELSPTQWHLMALTPERGFVASSLNARLEEVASVPTSIRMALWDDADGQPRNLMAATDIEPAEEDVNTLELPLNDRATLLADETYWVGISVSEDGATLSRREHEPSERESFRVTSIDDQDFGTDPQDALSPFPEVSVELGEEYGIYLRGKDMR